MDINYGDAQVLEKVAQVVAAEVEAMLAVIDLSHGVSHGWCFVECMMIGQEE